MFAHKSKLILFVCCFISLIDTSCKNTKLIFYENRDFGISLEYPTEAVKKTTSEDVLVLTFGTTGAIEVSSRTLETVNNLFVGDFDVNSVTSMLWHVNLMIGGDLWTIIEDPTEVTVNGLKGATMTLQAKEGDHVKLSAAIIHNEQIIFINAFTTTSEAEEMRLVFEEIIHSIKPLPQ